MTSDRRSSVKNHGSNLCTIINTFAGLSSDYRAMVALWLVKTGVPIYVERPDFPEYEERDTKYSDISFHYA